MSDYPAGWAARVCVNLFPLSVEQHDLSKALKEWAWTGGHVDHGENAYELCEMCDKTPLRYHFQIENGHTKIRLWVGSECIKRFGVDAIDDDGQRLSGAAAKAKVDKVRSKMIDDARKGRVLEAINAVIDLEDRDYILSILQRCLADHEAGKALSPKLMSTLGWRLRALKIPHNPRDFRVAMRRDKHKIDLRKLDDFKVRGLIPYLSASQREILYEMKPHLQEHPEPQTSATSCDRTFEVETKAWDDIFSSLSEISAL